MPDGSVVTVPPAGTRDAVFEALHAGIKTVVIVTERIPRRDVAMMVELADAKGARIIGPNCLGVIVPEVCKMGGIGGPAKDAAKAYTPGPIGVMSRSGGMTTEISSTLTGAGLGQSTAISIGGDAIIGSTYAELMPLFAADEETEGIVIYTEPGGRMEAQLAEWVTENYRPCQSKKCAGGSNNGTACSSDSQCTGGGHCTGAFVGGIADLQCGDRGIRWRATLPQPGHDVYVVKVNGQWGFAPKSCFCFMPCSPSCP